MPAQRRVIAAAAANAAPAAAASGSGSAAPVPWAASASASGRARSSSSAATANTGLGLSMGAPAPSYAPAYGPTQAHAQHPSFAYAQPYSPALGSTSTAPYAWSYSYAYANSPYSSAPYSPYASSSSSSSAASSSAAAAAAAAAASALAHAQCYPRTTLSAARSTATHPQSLLSSSPSLASYAARRALHASAGSGSNSGSGLGAGAGAALRLNAQALRGSASPAMARSSLHTASFALAHLATALPRSPALSSIGSSAPASPALAAGSPFSSAAGNGRSASASSSSMAESAATRRRARRYSPISVAASPLVGHTSSTAAGSGSESPALGRSLQRLSLHTSARSASASGDKRHEAGQQAQGQQDSEQATRRPSAADDPYPLPFSPELDPAQRGPQRDGPSPQRVSASALEQGAVAGSGGAEAAGSELGAMENLPPARSPGDAGEHVSMETASQNDYPLDASAYPLRVPGREDEDRDTKIARLVYQARKRGTLETDLILATWAKKELKSLKDEELDEFDRLLDEPDWDIFYWCTARKAPPARWEASFSTPGRIGHRLRIHTRNDEKVARRMPALDLPQAK